MTVPDQNENPIEWQLVDTDLETVLAILPASTNSSLYLELNEPGSGELKVPLLSTSAALITSGQFVRALYRGAIRGGFFVENISKSQVNAGEGGELWTAVSGRGPLSIFERARVWTDGTVNTTREFTDKTKAEILITLIEEAQDRGGLSNVTYDFTATDDSNAVAWTDSETMQFTVGKSYLDVIREMAELGIDFWITIETDGTFNLSAYSTSYGTDKSDTVYFRRGSNCTEVGTTEMGGEIANALLIKYDGGFSYAGDSTSITARGRREGVLDAIDAFNSDHALTYGQARLQYLKNPKTEQNVRVYDGIGTRAFVDYSLGDYITLDLSGVETSNRVRSMQLTWAMNEKADVVVGLNSTVFENEIRQSNDIRKLFEMWRRAHDSDKLDIDFWAAIGKLSDLATTGTAVYAMAVSDAGILYVGGAITKIGSVTVGNAAQYNINTGVWSALGSGFNDTVYAIDTDGTNVYFGGSFSTADGVTCSDSVARWSETTETFTAIATGTNPIYPIKSIKYNGGRVYIGGTNDAPLFGGDYACIGYIDTADDSWNEMPGIIGELNIDANSIDTDGIKVYVGLGQSSNGTILCSWDIVGETWTTHAINYDTYVGDVFAVKIYNGYLYIGGNFNGLVTPSLDPIADTIAIARMSLDTEVIESFDGGFTNSSTENVRAFTVSDADLIIGGTFAAIGSGSLAASNIAKWNNGLYSVLGTGLNDTCYALTVYNGNIGAGGVFTQAGGKPIKYVGAYITNFDELTNYLETGGGADSSGYTHPNHTGDVTSVGDGATTIALNSVTNAKLNNMAEGTVKARLSTGTGDPEDVTLTDLGTALGVAPVTYTADRVLISGTGTATTDSNLTYDATNDRLELGIGVPANSNGGFGQAYEGVSVGHYLATWGSTFASFIRGVFARGTKASPTAAQADDVEFRVRASAHDGSTYPSSNMEIRFLANENQSNTAHGSRIEFYTTPNGSTTLTKAATITNDGDIDLAAGTYNIAGVPHTHTSTPNFQRNLTADLSLADGEAVVTAGYINAGAYNITLAGDSDLIVIQGNDSIDRAGYTTSTATPSINVDLYDSYELTAQAVNITSVNVTGSPNRNQLLYLIITSTGTITISFGSSFESGMETLPTGITGAATLEVLFRYNTASSKFRCVASGVA